MVRPDGDRRGDCAGSIVFVLGTRPEIIKVAPVADFVGGRGVIVHTGQHYDEEMSKSFFTACGLPEPSATLDVGGRQRGTQIGEGTSGLTELFLRHRPAAVVVQGDTNAALSGALAANAVGVPLVHIEAGLRSNDRLMPEEHNRILIDHLSDVLCAATTGNAENLLNEGISRSRITLTGNSVVNAVLTLLPDERERLAFVRAAGVRPQQYVLATIHRPENTDDPDVLATVLHELVKVTRAGWPVVLPLHPRTANAIEAAGLSDLARELILLPPVGYPEFLSLARHAALIVSDSGGLQEEVTVLKRPLVVLRRSTERPEALENFAFLTGPDAGVAKQSVAILSDITETHARLAALPSPFGGRLSSRLIGRTVLAAAGEIAA